MSKTEGSKKTGGRTKGTPNKSTLCLLRSLEQNNIDIVNEIAALLPQLGPEKKADVLLNLMSYIFPKRKAIELSGVEESLNGPQIIVTLPANGKEAFGTKLTKI